MAVTGERGTPGAIAVLRFDLHRGQRFTEHTHSEDQLVWAPTGVLTVEIGEQSWILPPTLALWVPAGVAHATSATRPSSMASIYLVPGRCRLSWTEPTVIAVGPLLRDLILYLEDPTLSPDVRSHTEAVVCNLLLPVSVTTVAVPMPPDPRALDVAEAIVADPADPRGLGDWASHVGASVRTLSRLFADGTGMTFVDWRAHARMRAALGLLADGSPVKVVAGAVGYSTASAFVSAFHRVTGQTPASYFKAGSSQSAASAASSSSSKADATR